MVAGVYSWFPIRDSRGHEVDAAIGQRVKKGVASGLVKYQRNQLPWLRLVSSNDYRKNLRMTTGKIRVSL